MSNYHRNEFVGFGTCAPPNFMRMALYLHVLSTYKNNKGHTKEAPYGLRKIEAQLCKEGFDTTTISPNYLKRVLPQVNLLCIYTMDPFGLGPASTTLSALFKKEPYLAKNFKRLLNRPDIKEAKKHGLKIIVGGPGAWQFQYRRFCKS